MSMPGFMAETSLYTSTARYVGRSTHAGAAELHGVTPQLPAGFCMADCDQQFEWGSLDNAVCKFGCMGGDEGGGGGGGGGGGPSDCALCYRSCARKPPRQRKACREDCREFC